MLSNFDLTKVIFYTSINTQSFPQYCIKNNSATLMPNIELG